MQSEKVELYCEKGAKTSFAVKKIVMQGWPYILIMESKQARYVYLDMIKKLKLHLLTVSVLLNIIFWKAKISAQNWYNDLKNSPYQVLPI